ncbi:MULTISPECIES: AAA family ATPase [unclassified Caballeronia]|uniref:AAA family ATPase n=1 Tax=unclassified Caballeronia TaxID=2646786 RepID=UPI0020293C89|nr:MULTISPECIES: AAA family ATPase [unclassified Caballeronia]MDR5766149.1 AAA family ATPase [Caballeronia sp. LZ028]
MRLPKLSDLVGEQMVVYEHDPDQHLFVAGPPGSGKTSLAVYRARFLRELGQVVVLVTRNKMLAALAEQLDDGAVVARTMHTFVSNAYRATLGGYAPTVAPYIYDFDTIIRQYEMAGVVPALDHLIVDEGQNLPEGFFRWAVRFAARTVTVFADEDQTTDPLRATLRDICAAGMPAPHCLRMNHRNTSEIADVAEHFHRSAVLPPGLVQRNGRGGEMPTLTQVTDWDQFAGLVATRFENRSGSIGVILHLRDDVLALRETIAALLPEGTRVDAYVSRGAGSASGIRLLDPGVTVLSSESVIGLEFDAVYLQDLSRSLPCATNEQARRMYMLCARARDSLNLVDGPIALSAAQISGLPPAALLAR